MSSRISRKGKEFKIDEHRKQLSLPQPSFYHEQPAQNKPEERNDESILNRSGHGAEKDIHSSLRH